MKYQLFFIAILMSCSSYSQVGQTAAQIAIDIADATLPVTTTMVAINLHQQDVLKYSKSIAEKTAAIMVLKEAELAALKTKPNGIEETTPWKKSVIYVDGIIQYNANTSELINDYPGVEGLPIETLSLLTEETIAAFSDIIAIADGGDDNLMSPAGRYKLIKKTNQYLKKLYDLSNRMNQLTRMLIVLSDEVPIDTTIDITEPIENILDQIDNLIIE